MHRPYGIYLQTNYANNIMPPLLEEMAVGPRGLNELDVLMAETIIVGKQSQYIPTE